MAIFFNVKVYLVQMVLKTHQIQIKLYCRQLYIKSPHGLEVALSFYVWLAIAQIQMNTFL